MDDTVDQHRSNQEPSAGANEEPRGEAARAVAKMLANPRRTRRS